MTRQFRPATSASVLAIVHSGALQGIEAVPVQVECNIGEFGEAKHVIVGLASQAVKESLDRVLSALSNSGFRRPQTKATINLAPGHLRKEGPLYDLPIALAMLMATRQMRADELDHYLIAGELSLSGEVRPIRGGLALGMLAKKMGLAGVILPARTAAEAALVEDLAVYAVDNLAQARAFLDGEAHLPRVPSPQDADVYPAELPDFADVKGQHSARRALEVAAAGAHNALLIGPPGSGKSLMAKRLPSILPPLARQEFLEVLRIYSAAGKTVEDGSALRFARPFRSPHHTISDIGLIGGGAVPGPGEISLAHRGVLFLDELPEFNRSVLEVLRQPLEDGSVTIARSAGHLTLPADFMLIAAMNPTPDGLMPGQSRSSPREIQRYRARVSGPLLDRIDLHVEAPALSIEEMRQAQPGEPSAAIRARVAAARQRQHARFQGQNLLTNAEMSPRLLRQYCQLAAEQGRLLEQAMTRLSLSARAYDRILKVARTIADLADSDRLETPHLLEAIQYRSLDRALS